MGHKGYSAAYNFSHSPFASFVSRHKGGIFAGAFAAAGVMTIGVQAHVGDTSEAHIQVQTTSQTPNSSLPSAAPSPISESSEQPAADNTATQSSNVRLTINGQDVAVPANGTVQQTVPASDGGETSVSVNSQSQGTSGNNSSSSLNVDISSDTSSNAAATGSSFSNQSTFISQSGSTYISNP